MSAHTRNASSRVEDSKVGRTSYRARPCAFRDRIADEVTGPPKSSFTNLHHHSRAQDPQKNLVHPPRPTIAPLSASSALQSHRNPLGPPPTPHRRLPDGERRRRRVRTRPLRLPLRDHRRSGHHQAELGHRLQRCAFRPPSRDRKLTRARPGELQSVDGYMNIALEQTQEIVGGKVHRSYGDTFIRGNNVMYISAD